MNATVGTAFETTTNAYIGLVGTIAVGIYDENNAVVSPLSTAEIVESGYIYTAVRFAPDTPGTYTIIWSLDGTLDPGQTTSIPLNVTTTTPTLYITRDEMKSSLSITGQTYADDDIDRACNAVSRAIDEAVRSNGSHFYQATETRYYTPDDYNSFIYGYGDWREHRLEIDDCTSVTSVTVDTSGDGSYATTWVEGTDFFLDPANAAAAGKPFEEIVLRSRSGRLFPRIQRAIKIIGVFGWPTVPPEVSQYASIFAAQQVLRSRQAPYGIVMADGAAMRVGRYDPDFERLLGSYVRPKLFI